MRNIHLLLLFSSLYVVVTSERFISKGKASQFVKMRSIGSPDPSDDELLEETSTLDREIEKRKKTKFNAKRGKLRNEVKGMEVKRSSDDEALDDYDNFESKDVENEEAHRGSSTPKYKSHKRPSEDDDEGLMDGEAKGPSRSSSEFSDDGVSTSSSSSSRISPSPPLSPVPIKGFNPKLPIVPERPPLRAGYYFQHYPWYLLPRQYRLRPTFHYVYPPQYQGAVWSFPGQLPSNYDPFAIYHSTKQARDYYYGGGGGGGCGGGGGGCGGGGSGGYSSLREDFENEDEEGEARDGDAEFSKKKDPLDDLDIETLEKIDKLGSSEKETFAVRARALKARV